jgi:hypothetical protein
MVQSVPLTTIQPVTHMAGKLWQAEPEVVQSKEIIPTQCYFV